MPDPAAFSGAEIRSTTVPHALSISGGWPRVGLSSLFSVRRVEFSASRTEWEARGLRVFSSGGCRGVFCLLSLPRRFFEGRDPLHHCTACVVHFWRVAPCRSLFAFLCSACRVFCVEDGMGGARTSCFSAGGCRGVFCLLSLLHAHTGGSRLSG
jgi:hypothetical protein